MPYLIGCAIALAVCCLGLFAGFDKDRSFYPTTLMVIASYYVLFAVMGGSAGVIVAEILGLAVFIVAAILGQRTSAWITAFALAAHGAFDAFHDQLLNNPGVPVWWPAFCLTYDVSAALFLVSLLIARASLTGDATKVTWRDPQATRRQFGQSILATSTSSEPATSSSTTQ